MLQFLCVCLSEMNLALWLTYSCVISSLLGIGFLNLYVLTNHACSSESSPSQEESESSHSASTSLNGV